MALKCSACNVNHFGIAVKCQLCGKPLIEGYTEPVPESPAWPKWADWISKYRIESDKGVGDTLERLLAKFGGRVLKRMMKSVGFPCGCDQRQLDYNRIYPYRN